jgi:hypothetical protein
MIRRRSTKKTSAVDSAPAFGDFHDWVLSLPWVVERSHSLATPGVRSFAIDCEPLGRRQLWLVTGLHEHLKIGSRDAAVILPLEAARSIENAGRGRALVPMPGQNVLMAVPCGGAGREEIEAITLVAYSYAMS